MNNYRIPFNRPYFSGKELEYIRQAIDFGHISGNGKFTQTVSSLLETELGVPKVLLTTSCTHALEMAAILLNVESGDEVIVPTFTFVSTINAFVLRGARPVFVDIREDTFNMDEKQIESLITPRTKVIVPVHYAGVACEMDTILKIASTHGVYVVEDNAHGLFGKYKGKYLGTFGSLATQSFHETKNFTCGEGGALIINDVRFMERAEIIREKGTDRSRFFRGEVDKYTWVDIGSSYLLSDILAAFLYAQIEARETIQGKRRQIWKHYMEGLSDWAKDNDVRLPIVPEYCEHTYHLFYMLMPDLESRSRLIDHLKQRGILSVFHYVPLHLSSMGKQWGYSKGEFPVAEKVGDTLLRLPLFVDLSTEEQDFVIDAIREFKV